MEKRMPHFEKDKLKLMYEHQSEQNLEKVYKAMLFSDKMFQDVTQLHETRLAAEL